MLLKTENRQDRREIRCCKEVLEVKWYAKWSAQDARHGMGMYYKTYLV